MNETKLKKYDAVELRGVWLGNDFQWWPGYYILEIQKDGSFLISRTYKGDHNITQLTWPYQALPEELRKPETPPKLSVTGGVYNAQNFLQEYGACMLRAYRQALA